MYIAFNIYGFICDILIQKLMECLVCIIQGMHLQLEIYFCHYIGVHCTC